MVKAPGPVLLIPEIARHPAEPVAAYTGFLLASITTSTNQLLLTVTRPGKLTVVTVDMLSRTLRVMLDAVGMDVCL